MDEEIRKELESLYDEQEPSRELRGRVHRSVITVSVARSIVLFFVGAVALLARSALESFAPTVQGESKRKE